ncbi:hypothetical protein P4S72_13075 [Vibrio sp. PP-XX7]
MMKLIEYHEQRGASLNLTAQDLARLSPKARVVTVHRGLSAQGLISMNSQVRDFGDLPSVCAQFGRRISQPDSLRHRLALC